MQFRILTLSTEFTVMWTVYLSKSIFLKGTSHSDTSTISVDIHLHLQLGHIGRMVMEFESLVKDTTKTDIIGKQVEFSLHIVLFVSLA